MLYQVMLILSVAVFVLFVGLAYLASIKHKGARGLLRPLNIVIVGVFLSGALLYLPIYFAVPSISLVEVLMNTVHDVLQLFTVDSDMGVIYEGVVGLESETLRLLYSVWFSLLYGLSPILTFSFLLSFFKNVNAYLRYASHFFSNVYIFSELNERSLVFAENILKGAKKAKANAKKNKLSGMHTASRAVVFLGVDDENEEMAGVAERARALGAILFSKDIVSARLSFHSKKRLFNVFLISEDESANVDLTIGLLTVYGKRPRTHVYVFSDSAESELLLNHAEREKPVSDKKRARLAKKEARFAQKLAKARKREEEERRSIPPEKLDAYDEKIRRREAKRHEEIPYARVKRVNVIRALINQTLYETGEKALFHKDWSPRSDMKPEEIEATMERRALAEIDGEKILSVVVIGMGLHGMEMVKGLAWYGQMVGYRLYINAFDSEEDAKSIFAAKCPELMSKEFNSPEAEGQEDCYRISIHKANVFSLDFREKLKTLPKVSYIVVCLGDDEKNLEVAVQMRSFCATLGWEPYIQAIRYNTGENEDFSNARNFKGQPYEIDLIGDMKNIYSEKVILYSELEEKALARHLKWGDEDDFWKFEYNYNSSVASALHHELKIHLGLPGADLAPNDRTPEEKDVIRRLEHRRWNAYMRSEGYVFANKRNDLAKQHHFLVFFDKLPPKEQAKDDD